MPHKHKRRQKEESNYDLPPTTLAKPLPVHKGKPQSNNNAGKKAGSNSNNTNTTNNKKSGKNKSQNGGSKWADDTPRAFARLMRFQKVGKMPSGLDDGNNEKPQSKKRKRGGEDKNGGVSQDAATSNSTPTTTPASKSASTAAAAAAAKEEAAAAAALKILPGEKLSDFAARVDQAMPLSSMKKSQRSQSDNLPKIREERITKHEKHLRKLQQGWREEEARISAKEAEERELREAQDDELAELWKEWQVEAGKIKPKNKNSSSSQQSKKKKKRKHKGNGTDNNGDDDDDDDDDDDPWAKLNTRERAAKPINPLEVVQAPPESLAKPREIFRIRRGVGGAEVDVANIPATAGSLRRREELAEERKSIVEEYRRLMAAKRGQ